MEGRRGIPAALTLRHMTPAPEPPPASHGGMRREIPQRSTGWARATAAALAHAGWTPNAVSMASVVIALIGAVALAASGALPDGGRAAALAVTACAIPLRLLCNMLDGMLAVEHSRRTPSGDLFNELPDRIADALLLAAAGYATAGLWVAGGVDIGAALGWTAAVLAVLTAYVRTLGAANGVGNFFNGPMPKPVRMWMLVVASLLSLLEPVVGLARGWVIGVALAIIAVGSLMTVIVRLRRIVHALREDS